MKNLIILLFPLALISCSDKEMEARLHAMEAELKEAKAQLEEQSNTTINMIHTVYFWLKEDLTDEQKASFVKDLKSLGTISTIKGFYIGPPAPTEVRDVIDNSYSYALITLFEDVAGHDAYQVDPIHLKFIENQKNSWTRVQVYDNMIE